MTVDEKDNQDQIVFSTSPIVTDSDTRNVRKKNYDVKMSDTLKNKIKYLNDNSLGGQDTDLSQIKSDERRAGTASRQGLINIKMEQ